ncbi:hypothetical protein KOW79_021265 [Hemibagrus wyckioides]|uniref:Uncharacterized protein n=1 Tax=Hemibagrus wyckioides TaxID=337641 RepID=A0A9D3N3L3_9TELE|nr:hypothetical protein KOW79_021265 [Hemibagrus wyckioides]
MHPENTGNPSKHNTVSLPAESIEDKPEEIFTLEERATVEKKAYHPFVWNSLSPYRDTTEIDYLFAMSSSQRSRDRRASAHLSH